MATAVRERLRKLGVGSPYIGLGSPRENGHPESSNGKLRDRLLARGCSTHYWRRRC